MVELIQEDSWVWVVVMDPEGHEQFVGQKDQSTGVSFLPAFLEKEEALKGLAGLTREEGHTYEVQAVRDKELARNAADHGFTIFVLDGEGRVLEKKRP